MGATQDYLNDSTIYLFQYDHSGNPRLARFWLALTLVNMVKLFVTMAQLAQGQTLVSPVKIGACRVKIHHVVKKFAMHWKNLIRGEKNRPACAADEKIRPAGEDSLILQFNVI